MDRLELARSPRNIRSIQRRRVIANGLASFGWHMVRLRPMGVRFEWDERKAGANLAKHSVAFHEALTVFTDPLARIFDDEDHSREETREIIIGQSVRQRLLVVCFSERDDTVRIINARQATKRERDDYEENTQS